MAALNANSIMLKMQSRFHTFVQNIDDLNVIRFDIVKNDVAVEMKAEEIGGDVLSRTALVGPIGQIVKALIQLGQIHVALSYTPGLFCIATNNPETLTRSLRQTKIGHGQTLES